MSRNMMRENSSSGLSGRTSRPASFPNMGMNAGNIGQPHPQLSSQKIKDVTKNFRNLNFRDSKNKTKRLSLTDSEASDTASIGRSRGAGGSVLTSRQTLQKQSTSKTKNEKLLKIRAGLENNQYERVDVARETVVNAIDKKMQQDMEDTDMHGNYGDVYYMVQNNKNMPVSVYAQPSIKDPMNVVNTLSRGSPDGASYRAESPSTFHAGMHNSPSAMAANTHYEPVHPIVLTTGATKYRQKQPTTEPPAYANPHNMYFDYSGQNSIASDNSSSTGTGSQYLSSVGSYSGLQNHQPHIPQQMYEHNTTGMPTSSYMFTEARSIRMYPDNNMPITGHSGQPIMDDSSVHSQDPMHRPIIKGNYTNPPPSYMVSQNFKNKQSNDQSGVYAINSALTGNLNAIRYENNPTSHHNNQPYQPNPDPPPFTTVPGPAIRQAVSSQPVSKPLPMHANQPTAKDMYYNTYDADRSGESSVTLRSHQNPHQYMLLQDRKPPPYVNNRNSASLENQFQSVQINNNNGLGTPQYESDKNKTDNFQKPKVAENYLNAVENQTRNVSSVRQARANISTNSKYNQPIPQDAEAAAKAARVTASNTKRAAGSYSQVCSAKQHRAEPPAYESKDIRTSPVPQRKSYRDKTGKKHQEIQNMQVGYSDSEDEDDSANPEEEPRIRRVKVYSPEAFKFYMEQHIENIIKGMRSRNCRRMQLEYEMNKMNLPDEERNQMRKMLFQKESNHIRLKRARIHKNMFDIIKKLGVGAFGEVMLARRKTTGALFAIKILKKREVLSKNQVAHVKAERDILAEADNDWVVRLYYTFQDRERLYFVMDYIPGGDLMSLLIRKEIFDERLALFYTAELCLALESVHKMGFIHRDIKPDNILIDRDGHIKLTDFGLCTGFRWTHDSKYYLKDGHKRQDSMDFSNEWRAMSVGLANKLKTLDRRRMIDANRHTAKSLVGTPNYIAPEVLMREGYTELCDWWSVGVILYEMVIGQPPFNAPTPDETQMKVIRWRECLNFPDYVRISPHTENIIKRLCCDKENRLGKRGAAEIKAHRYFEGIDWTTLRQTKPPFVPQIKHPEDTSNFDCPDNEFMLNPSMSATLNSNNPTMLRPGEHAFFEFTFRRFFDEDGRAYQLGSNNVQSGADILQTIEMEDEYDDTPPSSNFYSNV